MLITLFARVTHAILCRKFRNNQHLGAAVKSERSHFAFLVAHEAPHSEYINVIGRPRQPHKVPPIAPSSGANGPTKIVKTTSN